MLRSILFKILVGLTVVITLTVGSYGVFSVRESSKKLYDESLLMHRVLLESALPSLALGLWNMDDKAVQTAVRSLFKYGEVREVLVVGDTGSPLLYAFEEGSQEQVTIQTELDKSPEGLVATQGLLRISQEVFPGKLIPVVSKKAAQDDAGEAMASSVKLEAHRGDDQRFISASLLYSKRGSLTTVGRIFVRHTMDSVEVYAQDMVRKTSWFMVALTVFIIGLVLLFLYFAIIKPVRQLARASLKVASGDFSEVAVRRSRDEIGLLSENFNFMVHEISRNTENLAHLVLAGQNIASQTSLVDLLTRVEPAFQRIGSKNLRVGAYFSGLCMGRNDLASSYFSLGADGELDLSTAYDGPEVQRANPVCVEVADPHNGEILALVALSHSDSVHLAKTVPSLKALATHMASAITTVRLEQAFEALAMRTQEVRSILTNINQGICVIGENCAIGGEYSEFLKQILREEELENRNLIKLFETLGALSSDCSAEIQASLSSSIGENSLNYETNIHILPREVSFTTADRTIYLELEWIPLLTPEDVLARIMVTIRDVTMLRTLNQQAESQGREIRMITELATLNPAMFWQFSDRTQEACARLCEAFAVGSVPVREVDAALQRDLHTIKGTGRTLRLSLVACAAHESEETYLRWVKDPSPESLGASRASVVEISAITDEYCRLATERLNRPREEIGAQVLLQRSLKTLRHMEQMPALPNELLLPLHEVRAGIMQSLYPTVHGLLNKAFANFPVLARELGKRPPQLDARGDTDWVLTHEAGEAMFSALVHMTRNSLDHGFQCEPDPRISVTLRSQGEFHELIYEANEEGLDLVRLRDKGASMGHVAQSDDEIAQLMFVPSLTTREFASSVSGRGVGMDAVLRAVERVGGHVWIEFTGPRTEHGRRPFRIHLSLPHVQIMDRIGLEYTPYGDGATRAVA